MEPLPHLQKRIVENGKDWNEVGVVIPFVIARMQRYTLLAFPLPTPAIFLSISISKCNTHTFQLSG